MVKTWRAHERYRSGVFRTALNAELLDNTPRGNELLMRTPMGRFGMARNWLERRCFRLRCGIFCYRTNSCGGRRVSREWRESMSFTHQMRGVELGLLAVASIRIYLRPQPNDPSWYVTLEA